MNNTQRARLDAGNRFKVVNKKYVAELATIPEYAAEEQTFNDAMVIIDAAALAQTATVGGSASAADKAKQTMASITIKYALRAAVKARQIGNQVLAVQLDHPFTYISYAPKTQSVHRAKDIRDNLDKNLAVLTNITIGNIAEIDSVISIYDSIKDAPTIDVQSKTASGTNPLPDALNTASHAMDNMYDLAVSYFIDTNRPLVDEMALAKQQLITGVHHNGLDGIITKAGQPIFGASITIAGSNKTTTSDKDGHYILGKLKTGSLAITAAHPDGTLQTKTITISKANVETVDFEF
jgi:hypothetical protein